MLETVHECFKNHCLGKILFSVVPILKKLLGVDETF